MANNLNELIHVYDDCLTDDICENLIYFFEENPRMQERCINDGAPNFYQFNFTENRNISSKINNIHSYVVNKVFQYRNKYYKLNPNFIFPKNHSFEQIRIKKYNPGGQDRFNTHVDVLDYKNSRRFISFLWYLNDIESGGNTVFNEIVIKPKRRRLLMFPPLWMFPHSGEPPISGPKYIMSTYLHYR
jgi:hypothetical protein